MIRGSLNGPWYGNTEDGRQRYRQEGRLQSWEETSARIHACDDIGEIVSAHWPIAEQRGRRCAGGTAVRKGVSGPRYKLFGMVCSLGKEKRRSYPAGQLASACPLGPRRFVSGPSHRAATGCPKHCPAHPAPILTAKTSQSGCSLLPVR